MLNITAIDAILKNHGYDEKALINILQDVQEVCDGRYISEETAAYVSKELAITKRTIYEVITFFAALRDHPVGEVLIQLCNSTVCKVKKNVEVKVALEEFLGIEMGETSRDNKFTLEYTTCFGACDVSPAIRINKVVYGNLDREKTLMIMRELKGELYE